MSGRVFEYFPVAGAFLDRDLVQFSWIRAEYGEVVALKAHAGAAAAGERAGHGHGFGAQALESQIFLNFMVPKWEKKVAI